MTIKINITSSQKLSEIITEKTGKRIKQGFLDVLAKENSDLINDDDAFKSMLLKPLTKIVRGAIHDDVNLESDFDSQFEEAMYHVRDELVVANDFSLDLSDQFDKNFVDVLKMGFEKSVEPA